MDVELESLNGVPLGQIMDTISILHINGLVQNSLTPVDWGYVWN